MKTKPTACNILIVDNEQENLILLSRMLTQLGHNILAVKTGNDALSIINSDLPDLVLLETNLPDISGYDVCKTLKTIHKSRAIPAIFISALNETAEKLQGFASGAVDYITKPFKTEEVVARVQTHLELSWLRSQLESQAKELQIKNLQLQMDYVDLKNSEKSLHSQTERLRNLHRIDQAILMAIESPEAIIQTALKHIKGLLHCQRTSVGLLDPDMAKVRVFAADVSCETVVQVGSDHSAGVYGDLKILQQGNMEIVENVLLMAPPAAIIQFLQSEGILAYINVPLISVKGLIGVLNVGWNEPKTISPEEIEISGEVGGQITIAIEQARLMNQTKNYAAELEQSVSERTAQLQAANQELEAFSFSVSHDLHAPLRIVHGYTKILLEEYAANLDNEGKKVCSVIMEHSLKMEQLIDELLSFSKISRTHLNLSLTNMKLLVNSVYLDLTDTKSQERITLELGEIHDAQADAIMIGQVWANLLSNAVKFSSKREKAVISVSSIKGNGKNIYCVKDNGAGFNMEYADKLFGVFQRLHSTNEFEGTGVGLAIVQRIVYRHGGEVWAEGEVDGGAAFYFSLPA
ncbi:MAG: response regulator [Bacteroidetes bacterium]|nr:response regulator [Bacteroidota bacterium]